MSKSKAPAKLPALPYTEPLSVMTLKGETHLVLKPDAEIRARIAKFAGLHALDSFVANLILRPKHDGSVEITGQVEADTQPICVVTLEPFADHVSEPVEALFSPPEVLARLVEELEEEDEDAPIDGSPELPDEIVNGQIDPAALAVEFLILGLDPYPRKPDADFPEMKVGEDTISPFAALKALKTDEGKG
ncbi:MAG: DUF177 domain-containing protein [Beijerinckiaceae bacterium]|jgi:uncharacterized metal-binding protein YceD (DUF177 family)|nr:DUF177 domain-containing protein [Beijerinckiaceae bacterium]